MKRLKKKEKETEADTENNKPTSGINLMKHNRLRVLSESSSNKIISQKNDLILTPNDNFLYKKNITIAEKVHQLKHKKYYIRKKNRHRYKNSLGSGNSLDTSSSSNSSSNNDISNSSTSEKETSRSHPPLISASSYSVDPRRYSKESSISSIISSSSTATSSSQHYNSLEANATDPSTLAHPIRQELQIKAKESISDIILAYRSLVQTSNVSNELSKTAYNFSLLDSVFSDIDSSITRINQNLTLCKQKDDDITQSLQELNEAQEGSRRVKDLVVAYITG